MIRVISVDPGAKYVGLAVFDREKEEDSLRAEQLSPSKALAFIETLLVEGRNGELHVVYEDFLMYGGGPGSSKTFNTMPELRWIGRLEELVFHVVGPDASIEKFGASIYKAATRQWGPPPIVSGRHMYDAWRLGLWYIIFKLKWTWRLDLRDGEHAWINS